MDRYFCYFANCISCFVVNYIFNRTNDSTFSIYFPMQIPSSLNRTFSSSEKSWKNIEICVKYSTFKKFVSYKKFLKIKSFVWKIINIFFYELVKMTYLTVSLLFKPHSTINSFCPWVFLLNYELYSRTNRDQSF